MRHIQLLSPLLLLAVGACTGPTTDLPLAAENVPVRLDTIASGLDVPWDFAFAPDGRIFVAERSGQIRVIENGRIRPEPWAELVVAQRSEMGLMGLALDPNFASNGYVYVVGTFAGDGGTENRLLRFTDRNGSGTDQRLIYGAMPAARFHAGAALDFGPDGMLYLSAGDATRPGDAQDLSSLAGKILRIDPSGAIPPDNPIPGSPIFAVGVRNSQGVAWHPETGEMFASDHGPSGLPQERFRRGRDELNLIVRGGNFGWPDASGDEGGEGLIRPLIEWNPTIAPAGIAFYTGEVDAWRNNVFVGALGGRQLLRVVLERDPGREGGWRAAAQEPLFLGELGRIRAVVMGPDGHLFFSTSNRDGRGSPSPADDFLFRLRPGP